MTKHVAIATDQCARCTPQPYLQLVPYSNGPPARAQRILAPSRTQAYTRTDDGVTVVQPLVTSAAGCDHLVVLF